MYTEAVIDKAMELARKACPWANQLTKFDKIEFVPGAPFSEVFKYLQLDQPASYGEKQLSAFQKELEESPQFPRAHTLEDIALFTQTLEWAKKERRLLTVADLFNLPPFVGKRFAIDFLAYYAQGGER